MPKIVVSQFLKGDVPSEVAKLKEGSGKDIQVMGSGELVQTLIRHDLIDEYRLMIHPLVLGTSKAALSGADAADAVPPPRGKGEREGVVLLGYGPANEAAAAIAAKEEA